MSISLPDLLVMTGKSLTGNLVRSGLTLLGVFMGVAAVSATLNIGSITRQQIALKLAERDRPYVQPLMWVEDGEEPRLDDEDQRMLVQAISEARAISTVARLWGLSPAQFEDKETTKIQAQGITLNYLETTGRRVIKGRFFNQVDFDQYSPVVLLDEQLAEFLFETADPRNQVIYVAGNRLTVIGVLESKSSAFPDPDSNGMLWVTHNTAKVLQSEFSDEVMQISARSLDDIRKLKERVKQFLKKRFPGVNVYIWDGKAEDLLKEKETLEIASRSLLFVGLIALVIGGVGIANITIAAVMERTKEIGLRRAIGATRLEIMLQFILEAVLLSVIGGTAAIATVHGLTQVATTVVFKAPYQFSLQNAAWAMGSAVLVGVGSSFFPALRATQVDIVAALRSE